MTVSSVSVKANVVFFDNALKDGHVPTKGVWGNDLRTNKHSQSGGPVPVTELKDKT